MTGGYMGKTAFINLSSGEIKVECLEEALARRFIGGYGLGVRMLYERQPPGVDPLGPESILGFTAGPLTGTRTPTGGRYMAVCKSPLTGGWGDANAGGFFGSGLKAAGYDAVFFSGIAPSPCYVRIEEGSIEIRDATQIWGRDTTETEAMIRSETGGVKTRVASIGPASERLSLISGIISDGGRAAARSGVGAVMGSKKMKAIAVHGSAKIPVADANRLNELRRSFTDVVKKMTGFPQVLMEKGTCGLTGALVAGGAAPIKNWQLAGTENFARGQTVTDAQAVLQHQRRRYACANCPIACGGIVAVSDGPYPLEESHKPEYETIGAFGPMCLNTDLASIFKLNDMCNRSGLDTISAGSVLAFAMECFEKGILSEADTDGIAMKWGDSEAMITMLDRIIRREGFGDVLADGVRLAAERIGRGSEACAVHVGGQEPGLHNALFLPSRATGYLCDPTPGRHTAAPMARLDAGPGAYAPYPEMKIGAFDPHVFTGKGPISAKASNYLQVGNCAGVCIMPLMFFGNFALIEFLEAVTGWKLDIEEVLQTGARIQTLRQCFNIREGIRAENIRLPDRMAGRPPMSDGPLAGVTIDADSLAADYRLAMGWDPATGIPGKETLGELGLQELVAS